MMSSQLSSSAATNGTHKLRILALHSFRTSAAIMKLQFEKAQMGRLSDIVELVYLDAPNLASGPIPRDVKPFFEGPYREWVTVEAMGDKLEFDSEKMERSMAAITTVMQEQGPFDGVVGFSQGAIMAAAVTGLQAAGLALQHLPRLKFCVLYAGMPVRYPGHAQAFASKVAIPSLHVYGDRDDLKVHCQELADTFANPVVIKHTRGHIIPALNDYQMSVFRAFLSAFLTTPTPSLGSGGSSWVAAGTG
ncbi:serine hydrolase FSH [Haematococcus lacustris]